MSAVSAPESLSTVFPVIICKTMTGGNNRGHVWNDKGTKISDLIQGMRISCIFDREPEQNSIIYKDLKKIICSPSSVACFILRICLFFVLSLTCWYCIASHVYHFVAFFFFFLLFVLQTIF